MSKASEMNELDEQRETVRLPLFPLRMVLFPGQVLPLHIFEPRYRVMVSRCIEEEEPFGVVLMREDTPDWREYHGDIALPYDVGTTAHIRGVEKLPDGRFNIITVGLHRFRIRQLHFDKPYLQGEVESYPLREAATPLSPQQMRSVKRLLQGYMKLLTDVVDVEVDTDQIPEDPRTLAFLAASVLQLPWDDKQELLAAPDLPTLLQQERLVLGRENMLLQYMESTIQQLEEQIIGPTGYLYPN